MSLIQGSRVVVPLYSGFVDNTRKDFNPLGAAAFNAPPDAGEAVEVVSADANDTIAGTGAQKVKVWYLDSTGALTSVQIDTNGVTAVDLGVVNFRRPVAAYVSQVGSGKKNAGVITLRKAAAGQTYGTILAGDNSMILGKLSVPLTKSAAFRRLRLMSEANEAFTVWLSATMNRNQEITASEVYHVLEKISFRGGSPAGLVLDSYVFPALCDVKLEIQAGTVGPHKVSGSMEFLVG